MKKYIAMSYMAVTVMLGGCLSGNTDTGGATTASTPSSTSNPSSATPPATNPAPNSSTSTPTAGSCTVTHATASMCVDFVGTGFTSADVSCTGMTGSDPAATIGKPASGNCSTTAAIGKCSAKSGSPTQLDFYYYGNPSTSPATECAKATGGGVWTVLSGSGTAGTGTAGTGTAGTGTAGTGTAGTGTAALPIAGLMGGAIQLAPMSIVSSVSNVAGGFGPAGFSNTIGYVDGIGAAAAFAFQGTMFPSMTTDGTNIYVADTNNYVIRKIVISSGAVTTLAGSVVGFVDGVGAKAQFNSIAGITTDGVNLYVTDTGTVRKVNISTGQVTTIAGTTGVVGSADGVGVAASFNYPWGITTDGKNLYVSDRSNNTIRKINIASTVVTTLAGSGAKGQLDGIGNTATFNLLTGLTTDGTSLFAYDGYCNIRKIVITTGQVTTLAGNSVCSQVDGVGSAAGFGTFYGNLTSDGTNLYMGDGVGLIRKIVIATGSTTTLNLSKNAAWLVGIFTPVAWAITTDGKALYTADSSNRVSKIQ